MDTTSMPWLPWRLTALLVASLVASCATGRKAQADAPHPHLAHWMERNADPRYPRAEYLVGIGVGPDAGAAVNQGRAAILAGFRTHIASTVTRLERESEQSTGDATSWSRTAFTTAALEAQVEGTLEGAEVVDTARTASTGDCWALVVVQRAQLARTLRRRIVEHELALSEVAAQARELLAAERTFRTLELLRGVPEQLAQLEAWRTELSLVDAGSGERPAGSRGTLAEWIALRQECAATLTFAIRVSATCTDGNGASRKLDASPAREALKGALRAGSAGLGVVESPALDALDDAAFDALSRPEQRAHAGGANFLVRARIDTVYSSSLEALSIYRGRFAAQIVDLRSGEVLVAELAGEEKGSRPHRNADVSATNCLRQVSGTLARAVSASLE